jgi:hypothetical protein
MPAEHGREMAVTRESKLESQSAQVPFSLAKAGQRTFHSDAQEILMKRRARLGLEHARQMELRETNRGGDIFGLVLGPRRGRDHPLHRRGERLRWTSNLVPHAA